MKKSLLYRQLLSYVPAFFIVVTFIFFIFFQILGQQTRDEAMRANESLLQHAWRITDESLKQIDMALLSEMITNPDLTLFFDEGKSDNVYLNMQVVRTMNQLKTTNPWIDSIYYVRTRDHFILSDATSSKLEEHMDFDFFQSYLNVQEDRTGWTGSRNYREFSNRAAEQVVSLVRRAPMVTNGEGLAVVNISVDAIYEHLNRIYDPHVSFIQIQDATGKWLMDNLDADQANEQVFSQLVSPYTGWVYESGMVNGRTLAVVIDLYNIWFSVGIVMIIAGVIWIVFVTRRNYKPIEQLLTRVQSFTQARSHSLFGGKGNDEFAFIEHAIEQMLEQSNHYYQQHLTDLQLKKSYYIQRLISGQLPEDSIVTEEWNMLQLPDRQQPHIVSVIEIDKFEYFCNQYSAKDQGLMKFALRSVIQELAQHQTLEIWMTWLNADKLGLLIRISPLSDAQQQAMNLLEPIRAWIEQYLKLTITAGIGNVAEELHRIPASCEEAGYALKYKMILGHNRVIAYEHVTNRMRAHTFDYLRLISSIAQSFRLMNEEWRNRYQDMLRAIEQEMLHRDEVVNLADYLLYCLEREMSLMKEEVQVLWKHSAQPELKAAIMQSDTWEQMKQKHSHALDHFYTQLTETMKRRNHADLILQVRAYMKSHSHNPDLSLESISEHFELNWKSLSKIFKEETGQKFVDYLIELRISHSQRLLLQTDRPIQEIAVDVGYANPISFGRMFKKMVGMTPGDYREQAQSGDN